MVYGSRLGHRLGNGLRNAPWRLLRLWLRLLLWLWQRLWDRGPTLSLALVHRRGVRLLGASLHTRGNLTLDHGRVHRHARRVGVYLLVAHLLGHFGTAGGGSLFGPRTGESNHVMVNT